MFNDAALMYSCESIRDAVISYADGLFRLGIHDKVSLS